MLESYIEPGSIQKAVILPTPDAAETDLEAEDYLYVDSTNVRWPARAIDTAGAGPLW